MAEVNAGKVIIDTAINNSEANAGLKSTEKMVASLKNTVNQTNKDLQASYRKYEAVAGENARVSREMSDSLKATAADAKKANSALSDGKSAASALEEVNRKILEQDNLIKDLQQQREKLSNGKDTLVDLVNLRVQAKELANFVADKKVLLAQMQEKYPNAVGPMAAGLGKGIAQATADISKAEAELVGLRQAIQALEAKNVKILSIDNDLKTANAALGDLYNQKREIESSRTGNGNAFANLQDSAQTAEENVKQLADRLNELENTQRASATPEFEQMAQDYERLGSQIDDLKRRRDDLEDAQFNAIGEVNDDAVQKLAEVNAELQKFEAERTEIEAKMDAAIDADIQLDTNIDEVTQQLDAAKTVLAGFEQQAESTANEGLQVNMDGIESAEESMEKLEDAIQDVRSQAEEPIEVQVEQNDSIDQADVSGDSGASELSAQMMDAADAGEQVRTIADSIREIVQDVNDEYRTQVGIMRDVRNETAQTETAGRNTIAANKSKTKAAQGDESGAYRFLTSEKDYKEQIRLIENTEKKIEEYNEKLNKMKATGVEETSQQFKGLQYDIQNAKEQLNELNMEKDRMEKGGIASSDFLKQLQKELANIQEQYDATKEKQDELGIRAFGSRRAYARNQSQFENGNAEKADQRLNQALAGIGAEQEWHDNALAISEYTAKMNVAKAKIAEVQTALVALRGASLENVDMNDAKAVESAIAQSRENLEALNRIKEQLSEAGADQNAEVMSGAMHRLSRSIDETKGRLGELRQEEQRLRDSGFAEKAQQVEQYNTDIAKSNAELSKLQTEEKALQGQGAEKANAALTKYEEELKRAQTEYNRLVAEERKLADVGDATKEQELAQAVKNASSEIMRANDALKNFKTTNDGNLALRWRDLQNSIGNTASDVARYQEALDHLSGADDVAGIEAWRVNQEAITENTDRLHQYQTELDELRNTDSGALTEAWMNNEAAIQSEEERFARLRQAVNQPIDPNTETAEKKFAFLSKYMDEYMNKWKRMTTLSGMLGNGIASVLTPIIHPIQAADRALGALISRVGQAISAFARMAGNAAISFLRRLADGAKNAAIQLARLAANAVRTSISKLGTLAAGVGKRLAGLGAMAAGAAKRILGMGKNAKRSSGGFKTSLKTIIKYAFGVRSLFFLVRRLRAAFKEGLGEIAKQNPELKAALDALSKAFSALKGSISAAFAPIVTVVAPALIMLMNLLTGAMNRLGEFFAALTGKTTYQKSIGKIGDSADKSSKRVKELNRQLAGFDDLNILSENKNSSTSESDFAYQTVPVGEGISDFVKQLQELFAAGKFEEIGKLFAAMISGVFDTIEKAISWDTVGEKITSAIKAITGVINGLITGIEWEKIGSTIGTGVNTIIKALNELLGGIEWDKLGGGLARGLNSLIDTVNWDELGELISKRFNIIIGLLKGFVAEFKWGEAGTKFAAAVSSLVKSVDWDGLGEALAGLIGGALDFLYNAVVGMEWDKMLDDFIEGFNTFVDEIGKKLESFVPQADEMGTVFAGAVNKIITGVEWSKLGSMAANGFNIIIAWLKAAVKDIKWGEAGTNLAASLNTLIGEVKWSDVGEFANSSFKGVLDFVQAFLDNLEEKKVADGIKDALVNIEWDVIASKTWTAIKTAFSKAGNFLDALFSESVDWTRAQIDPAYLEKVTAFNNKTLGEKIGAKLSEAINNIPWSTIGTTFHDLLIGAINFLEEFTSQLTWEQFGQNVQNMLVNAHWPEIAAATFKAIKSAFGGVGKFIDALFSEPIDVTRAQIDPGYLEQATEFNQKDIGYKIGKRLSDAIGSINWGDFGTTLSNAVKNLFEKVKSFFMALGEVDESGTSKLQQSLTDFFSKIDWWGIAKSIIEAAWEAFMSIGTALVNAILAPFVEPVGDAMVEKATALETGITSAVNKAFGLAENDEKTKSAVRNYASMLMNNLGYDLENAVKEGMAKFGVGEEYADEFIKDYIEHTNANMPQAVAATIDAVDQMGRAGTETAANNGVSMSEAYWSYFTTSIANTGNASQAFTDAMDYVLAAGDIMGNGESAAEDFYNGFTAMIMDNGKVKYDYLAAIEEIFGPGAAKAFENGTMSIDEFYNGITTNAVDGEGNISQSLQTIMDGVYTSINSGGYGSDTVKDFFDAIIQGTNDSEESVKAEVNDSVSAILGADFDALAKGKKTIKDFFKGWINGTSEKEEEAKTTLMGAFQRIVAAVKNDPDGVDEHSPSKSAEKIAKDFLEGFAQGAEDNQSSIQSRVKGVFEGISGAVSSVVSGVKGFFSNLFGGKKQESDTGISADDIAKPYEDGAARGKTALEGLNTTTSTETVQIKQAFSDMHGAIREAINTLMGAIDGLNTQFAPALSGVRTALEEAKASVAAFGDSAVSANTAINNLKVALTEAVAPITAAIGLIKTAMTETGALVAADMNTARDAVKGLGTDTGNTVKNMTAALKLLGKRSETAFGDIKQYAGDLGQAIKDTTKDINDDTIEKLNKLNADSKPKLDAIKQTFDTAFKAIKENAGSVLSDIQTLVGDALAQIGNDAVPKLESINGVFGTGFENVRSTVEHGMGDVKSATEYAFNDIIGVVRDKMDVANYELVYKLYDAADAIVPPLQNIVSAFSNKFSDVQSAIVDHIEDGVTAAKKVSWMSVGQNMINGILQGLNDGWPYLRNALQELARKAKEQIKISLGINSPSKVLRDEVGVNMALGVVEGWKDTESDILKAVSNISSVAAVEMEKSKITANVGIGTYDMTNGLDEVLTTFSDKVSNSFNNLIEKLVEISSAVTVREPAIAAGTVLPYNVAAQNATGYRGTSEASTALNDDTISVLMQLVNNQTSAIVQAIQQYGGTTVNIDKRSLTDTIIDEINRRTRAQGKSPLLF